jgi:TolB-like protein
MNDCGYEQNEYNSLLLCTLSVFLKFKSAPGLPKVLYCKCKRWLIRHLTVKPHPMSTKSASGIGELFSEELVHAQLQKIFRCPAFSVSDILRRFLTYIIEETLTGRSNTIKEYTIAVNVLNKPISFKPQHDAIVRIHAGRLRRALNYYYKDLGMGDEIEITVPKGSYVPVFGNKHLNDLNHEPDPKQFQNEHISDSITLVIMPFRTFETDISRLSFADNLGQQLSSEFGRFPDFSLISYYTTQQLTSRNKEIHELASNFGAQYVITGNVQFEARRLRVAVQLTDAHSGAQIWTELYHRNYSSANLFEVGDNIVSCVTSVLGDFNGIIIQQMSRGLTKNKYGNSYLTTLCWYNDFYSRFNEEIFKKAYSAMEYAVEQNPSNEIAWAFYGELSLLAFLFDQTTKEKPLIQGLRSARTALKINPLSQHGNITLALANIFLNNRQASIDALEYALTLNPNAVGSKGMIGCLMIAAGEYNRGIELIRKSMDLNKSHPALFKLFISLYHFKQREYSLAYQQADETGMPDLGLNIILRVSILSQMGRKAEADILAKSLKDHPLNRAWISKDFIHRFLLDQDLVDQLYKGFKSSKIPFLTVA